VRGQSAGGEEENATCTALSPYGSTASINPQACTFQTIISQSYSRQPLSQSALTPVVLHVCHAADASTSPSTTSGKTRRWGSPCCRGEYDWRNGDQGSLKIALDPSAGAKTACSKLHGMLVQILCLGLCDPQDHCVPSPPHHLAHTHEATAG